MDKKTVAAALEEMGTLLELQGANVFKSRAFHTASRAIGGVTGDLHAMSASGELLTVPGIGKSIAAIIGELLTAGSAAELEQLRAAVPQGLRDMLRIQGLGPKKVQAVHDALGISTLDELEAAARDGRVAGLPGFGAKTAENLLAGIAALRTRADKSLYPVAAEAATALLAMLRKQKGVIRADVAGSLRRRKEIIGDIDIVLSARDTARAAVMQAFVTHERVESVTAQGDTKSSVVLRGGIPCDLRIVTDAEYPFALNYFTGSKEHNVEMRGRARRQGWSLNEYGFTPLEEAPAKPRRRGKRAWADEADIYAELDLTYIPPELRENLGEFAASEQGTLPHLIEEQDLRGTFHCHSTWSDGVNTVAEMAAGARTLGWEYLGIADHSRVAAYAGGLTPEKVLAQFREIDALNEAHPGFRILKGTECDILPDGTLDWPEKVLASFEYVVVSVHSSFRMTEAEMTRRILRAVKNRHVTMLGHPTGRLLLSREPYPVAMEKVIDACADHGVIIEINAHPLRLDLDWRLCRYARDKGVTIAINPDAHAVAGLRDVQYGVGIARKGWLEKRHVLNAQHLPAVLEALEL